ncbi:hypothetical protein M9435_006905 [Picochlorum sp. BPE23]|nr:hypothetical protein M9435_006905 [Picochlorum sp. BPE23]
MPIRSSLGEELSHVVDQGIRVTDPANIPKPGFVIKSRDEDQRKVFINVCSSARSILPVGWEGEGDLMASWVHEDGWEENTRLEFFISKPKMDVDKRGDACTVIHCATHPRVLQAAIENVNFKMHLIAMVMSKVAKDTGMYLDLDIKLPRMKSKGSLESIMLWGMDETVLMDVLPEPCVASKKDMVTVDTTGGDVECTHRLHNEDWSMSFVGNPVHSIRIVVRLVKESCCVLADHPTAGRVWISGSVIHIDLPKCERLSLETNLSLDSRRANRALCSLEKETLTLELSLARFRQTIGIT